MQARFAPLHSDTKQELLEKALAMAQARSLPNVELRVRQELIDASMRSGHSERVLLHFTWLLGKYDEDPSAVTLDVLWRYKWILASVPGFPTIGLDRIESLLADFERRLIEAGQSTRPSDFRRASIASQLGDNDASVAAFRDVMARRRSAKDDCIACELSGFVTALGYAGHLQEALSRSEPLLDGRVRGCEEVPHVTLATLALVADRVEPGSSEAAELNRRGLALQNAENRRHVVVIAAHVHYYTRVGALDDASAVLETFAAAKAATNEPLERLHLMHASAVLAERIAEQNSGAELSWGLPAVPEQLRTAAEVGSWLREASSTLACAFDRRNGHDGVSKRLSWLEQRPV